MLIGPLRGPGTNVTVLWSLDRCLHDENSRPESELSPSFHIVQSYIDMVVI